MDLSVEHGAETHVVEVDADGTLETMAAMVASELRIDFDTFELWKGDECVRHARPSDADTPLASTTLVAGDTVVLRLTARHAAREKLRKLGYSSSSSFMHTSAAFAAEWTTEVSEKDIERLKLVVLAEELNPIKEFVVHSSFNLTSEQMRVLCEHGKAALLNQPDDDGNCVLHLLCEGRAGQTSEERETGSELLSPVCLSYGADPNVRNVAGDTPLHIATRAGHSRTVTALLEGGACPDLLGAHGESALTIAAKVHRLTGAFRCIKPLVKHGADVNICDSEKQTPLLTLLDSDVVKETALLELLRAGARGDAVDANGKSAVMLAVAGNYEAKLLDLVLQNGGDASYVDAEGNSPLHVVRGVLAAKVLLAAGADLERENAEGNAPLSAALAAHRFEAAQGLLEVGADPHHADAAGLTPAELVRQAPKASLWPPKSFARVSHLVPLKLSALMKGKARQGDARRCAAALLANGA